MGKFRGKACIQAYNHFKQSTHLDQRKAQAGRYDLPSEWETWAGRRSTLSRPSFAGFNSYNAEENVLDVQIYGRGAETGLVARLTIIDCGIGKVYLDGSQLVGDYNLLAGNICNMRGFFFTSPEKKMLDASRIRQYDRLLNSLLNIAYGANSIPEASDWTENDPRAVILFRPERTLDKIWQR